MGMVRVCDMLLVHNQAIRSFRRVMKCGELVRSPGIDRQILSDCASSPPMGFYEIAERGKGKSPEADCDEGSPLNGRRDFIVRR